jgi:hypothetical protein
MTFSATSQSGTAARQPQSRATILSRCTETRLTPPIAALRAVAPSWETGPPKLFRARNARLGSGGLLPWYLVLLVAVLASSPLWSTAPCDGRARYPVSQQIRGKCCRRQLVQRPGLHVRNPRSITRALFISGRIFPGHDRQYVLGRNAAGASGCYVGICGVRRRLRQGRRICPPERGFLHCNGSACARPCPGSFFPSSSMCVR